MCIHKEHIKKLIIRQEKKSKARRVYIYIYILEAGANSEFLQRGLDILIINISSSPTSKSKKNLLHRPPKKNLCYPPFEDILGKFGKFWSESNFVNQI